MHYIVLLELSIDGEMYCKYLLSDPFVSREKQPVSANVSLFSLQSMLILHNIAVNSVKDDSTRLRVSILRLHCKYLYQRSKFMIEGHSK